MRQNLFLTVSGERRNRRKELAEATPESGQKFLLRGSNVRHTAPKEFFLRQLLDKDDSCRDKNTLPAGGVRDRYCDRGRLEVTLAAFETKPASRHVFTDSNVVLKTRTPDARFEVYFGAGVLAPVFRRSCRSRCGRRFGRRWAWRRGALGTSRGFRRKGLVFGSACTSRPDGRVSAALTISD